MARPAFEVIATQTRFLTCIQPLPGRHCIRGDCIVSFLLLCSLCVSFLPAFQSLQPL
ncbi:hypothetical protein ASPBRDRAFT_461205 [Aspergillus brasiliensis CBS 101740]|uniref:Uncharacterized protein n=1 Tax=Aspergillus brasiliensis (strain CBS 101740 / IMI 381727 / IBT 21946) TaxID=767769 RepID=A0A1L9USR2_ASPBC|nr:hypothetical protein ASPBRDRAFT_461205 [Aspergillus brasiliensis CBS 101740]